jgi:histone H3/H4
MIVRPSDVRKALRRDGLQVSEDAIVAVASEVQRFAEELTQRTQAAFDEHNKARELQRLPPLHRVTDEHVRRARQ